MNRSHQTSTRESITEMIFQTFRLHGRLIAFGDEMVKAYGLTSARWQVMGSIALADADVTVPMIARNLGLSRQAVQRVANDLEGVGFIAFGDNPHHKRAKRVLLTPKGRRVYGKADRRYTDWLNVVAKGFTRSKLQVALDAMRGLDGVCQTYLEDAQVGRKK